MVSHILEVISRDEIAMAITYQEATDTTRPKKVGLPNDEGKMAQFQRHLFGQSKKECRAIFEYSGTTCRKRGTESRADITES